jgi:hypothetical protein
MAGINGVHQRQVICSASVCLKQFGSTDQDDCPCNRRENKKTGDNGIATWNVATLGDAAEAPVMMHM